MRRSPLAAASSQTSAAVGTAGIGIDTARHPIMNPTAAQQAHLQAAPDQQLKQQPPLQPIVEVGDSSTHDAAAGSSLEGTLEGVPPPAMKQLCLLLRAFTILARVG